MSKTQATEQPKPRDTPEQGTKTGQSGDANAPALDDRHAMETAAGRQEGDQPPETKTK